MAGAIDLTWNCRAEGLFDSIPRQLVWNNVMGDISLQQSTEAH
jgi:hypothetical protein